jgi:acetyl esterase/lipase
MTTDAKFGSFRLWSDELEAMRAEARAVIDAPRDSLAFGSGAAAEAGGTREEQVAAQRASMAAVTFLVPEAEEREFGGVPCRVNRPDRDARAVYLHFHGGAMIGGSAGMMDIPNQMTAREHGVAVVSVEYRKAPEFPWPAGPDDGVAVARELLEKAESEFGTDRLLIGGESAGAYMTAAVALRVRDELVAIDRVDGLNLVFGIYDFGRTPSQRGMRPSDEFDVLSPAAVNLLADCYLPERTDEERRSPEISPAYADLRGLPACFVSVGSCDHLLDDSLLFASRASAAGVAVDLLVLPELPHAFQMFDCGLTRAWAAAQSAWFAEHLA